MEQRIVLYTVMYLRIFPSFLVCTSPFCLFGLPLFYTMLCSIQYLLLLCTPAWTRRLFARISSFLVHECFLYTRKERVLLPSPSGKLNRLHKPIDDIGPPGPSSRCSHQQVLFYVCIFLLLCTVWKSQYVINVVCWESENEFTMLANLNFS